VTPSIEPAWMDEYDFETIRAIRSSDVATMRSLLSEGKSFDACNRNGETFLHLACRRSNLETINFLIDEARVRVDVRDLMGRTVLHDVCWRPTPSLEILATVIRAVNPELLLVEDSRGHSCFDYCRKEHWEQWVQFLDDSADMLRRRSELAAMISLSVE
jgi:hypothetical protein